MRSVFSVLKRALAGFATAALTAAALSVCLLPCPQRAAAESAFPYLSWPNTHSGLSGCYVDDVTRGEPHYGIDLTGDHEIYACAAGTVVVSRWNATWGYVVMLRHDALKVGEKYVYTEYAHLDSISPNVEVGDYIAAGAKIGVMGDTGTDSDGVHLHLSVKLSAKQNLTNINNHPGENVDPGIFLIAPADLTETYHKESTCCHDYYVGLLQKGYGTNVLRAEGEALNAPASIRVGGTLLLQGTISSAASTIDTYLHHARWITMVHCTVTDASGQTVLDDYRFPNATSFKIKDLRIAYKMKQYPAGVYRISITARDEVGNQAEVVKKKVTVAEKQKATPTPRALTPTPVPQTPTPRPASYPDAKAAYAALLRDEPVLEGGVPARVFALLDLDGDGVDELIAGRLTRGDGAADALLTMADWNVPAAGVAVRDADALVRIKDADVYTFRNGNAVFLRYLVTAAERPWLNVVDGDTLVTYGSGVNGRLSRSFLTYDGRAVTERLFEEWTDVASGEARYALDGRLVDAAAYRTAFAVYGRAEGERALAFTDNTAINRGALLGDDTERAETAARSMTEAQRQNAAAVVAFANAVGAFHDPAALSRPALLTGLEAILFLEGDITALTGERVYAKTGQLEELRFSAAEADALIRSLTGAPLPDAAMDYVQYPEEWAYGLLYGVVCENGAYRAAATEYNVWTLVTDAVPQGEGVWRVDYVRRYVFNDPDAPLTQAEQDKPLSVRLRETDGGYGFTVLPS